MQFNCTGSLFALASAPALPLSLVTVNPTIGTVNALCKVATTVTDNHVFVFVSASTIMHFTGDVAPVRLPTTCCERCLLTTTAPRTV